MMTKEQLQVIIGENIRKERIALGISMEKLSEIIDISPGFMGRIERGKQSVSFNKLLELANVFEVPISVFFYSGDDTSHTLKNSEKHIEIENLISGLKDRSLEFVVSMLKAIRAFRAAQSVQSSDEAK